VNHEGRLVKDDIFFSVFLPDLGSEFFIITRQRVAGGESPSVNKNLRTHFGVLPTMSSLKISRPPTLRNMGGSPSVFPRMGEVRWFCWWFWR